MCIIGRNVHFFNVNIILRAQLNWQTMGPKSLKSRMVQQFMKGRNHCDIFKLAVSLPDERSF